MAQWTWRLKMLAAAMAVAAATNVLAAPPVEVEPQPVRDAWIDGRLQTTYALNPHLNPLEIDTRVRNGVVTLNGTLSSDSDRELAVQIAERIEGVSKVVDQLEVASGARGRGSATAIAARDGERTFP